MLSQHFGSVKTTWSEYFGVLVFVAFGGDIEPTQMRHQEEQKTPQILILGSICKFQST